MYVCLYSLVFILLDIVHCSVLVFFRIIATVVIATGAYPLFVSIGSRYKRLGAVFGLAYTVTWYVMSLLNQTDCFALGFLQPDAIYLASKFIKYERKSKLPLNCTF